MKKDLNSVLLRPHVTEKATSASESSVYVFEVDANSPKSAVERAFIEKYKITPRKINIVTVPIKNVIVRGRRGTKGGGKKAYVFLKKGDKKELA